MRKILFLAPYVRPISNAAAMRCQSFADVLTKSGHSVKTISYEGNASERLFIKNKDSASRFSVRLFHELLSGIEVTLRVLLSGSDLVIFSYPPFIPTLFAATCCALINKRYIIDVRDTYPEPYFRKNLISEEGAIGSFLKTWVGFIYRRAEHVTTVTSSIVEMIKGYGVLPKNVSLIRNGYDADLFFPSEEKFEKFTAVFHGHLSHFRELHIIPRLAREVPEVDFMVIGDGAQGDIFRSENLTNLKYKGHLDHEALAKMVAKAHVGLSFRSEDVIGRTAFPVKVYEYMGAGLVSIVTPTGEVGEFLEQMDAGFQFENSEVNKIKEILLSLKNNKQQYLDQVERVLAVRKQFSRNEISEKIAEVVAQNN